MRLVADMHISPRTVLHLRRSGHDVVRVSEILPPTAPDEDVLAVAITENRVVLTQDLDFSRLVAVSGNVHPSVISLRLSSSRVEHVHQILDRVLPGLESIVVEGAIVAVEDERVRRRSLPIG
jgi:predicted nuclease of predicted toxin-antitoxin system